MENHDLQEPERERQWPVVPCPRCGAIDLDDCQCRFEMLTPEEMAMDQTEFNEHLAKEWERIKNEQ